MNKKQVRSFLGLCSYYRRFVFTLSRIAATLIQLTINGEAFIWGADQREAFEHLKNRLVTAPVLSHYDEDAATPIHTDAINQALGDAFWCKPKKASRE